MTNLTITLVFRRTQFELIEPLNTLYKDEVRALGTSLVCLMKLSGASIPEPGLAIRVMGGTEKIRRPRIWCYSPRKSVNWSWPRHLAIFTVYWVRSVGVIGDGRTYDYLAIRAITSIDGMTADFAKIPWDVLQISVRIVNEVDHVQPYRLRVTSHLQL